MLRSSRFLVLLFAATTLPLQLLAQTDAEAARQFYADGREHYEAGRMQEALTAFEQAYAANPLPGLLFNIGQCQRQLGRSEEALKSFQRYLKELPDAPNSELVTELIIEMASEASEATPPSTDTTSPPAQPEGGERPVEAEPVGTEQPEPEKSEAAPSPAPVPAGGREILVAGRDPLMVEKVCQILAAQGARPAAQLYKSRWTKQATEYAAALTAIEAARTAYSEGELDVAWRGADEAIKSIEKSYWAMSDPETVARAYLFRADLANARGDTATAEDSYLKAARLGGALTLNPATTSPLIIEGYQTARELLTNSPPGGLTVITEPKRATVWVDGEERGRAPLSLSLPAGPHLIRITHQGYDVWATQVPVEPDNVRELKVFLIISSAIDLAISMPTPERVRELHGLDQGRDWLVVTPEAGQAMYTYLQRDGTIEEGGPVKLVELQGIVALTQQQPEIAAAEPAAVEGPLHWGWMAAGAGGGLAALGGLGALTIEGIFSFTELGSGEDRLRMQLGERVLVGAAALGLVGGAAGVALALTETGE